MKRYIKFIARVEYREENLAESAPADGEAEITLIVDDRDIVTLHDVTFHVKKTLETSARPERSEDGRGSNLSGKD